MDGFSSHTFKWVNAKGEQFYVKYHFKSEVGNKTMTGSVDMPHAVISRHVMQR